MNLKIKVKNWKYSKALLNKNFNFNRFYILKYLPSKLIENAYNTVSRWKGYSKTPLIRLNRLSKALDLSLIHI